MSIILYMCTNVACRIESFKGAVQMPMNTCPSCQTIGTIWGATTGKPVK